MGVEDEAAELLHVIAQLNRWATRHTDLGIPAARARVLALVEDLAPVRVTTLAAADSCSQPAMTQQINLLERAGLVEREPDPEDARASLLRPSPAGVALLAQARQARAMSLSPALAALDLEPGQLAATTALLRRLLAAGRRDER